MLKNKVNMKHKLIITIVKKGHAKKVVTASKDAGAEGGTVLLGRGVGVHENKSFLGIPIVPEKEIILSLVKNEILEDVIQSIDRKAKLNCSGAGLGMIINTKAITGIAHLMGVHPPVKDGENEEGEQAIMANQTVLYDLIVTIVNKGDSDKVVDASKKAGAEGGTILSGRGTGIHEQAKLLNIMIEPEKEIILTLIDRMKTEDVLEQIHKDAELNEPGKGIAFVLEVERTMGINHILNNLVNKKKDDSNA